MKILSRGDSTIRLIMIDSCYLDAGVDEIKSNACDLVERDTLDLLWNSLPFQELLKLNKDKYLRIESEIEKHIF